MMVLPFIAGLGTGWQQAVNGQVRVVAESALTATFINFAVGTSVLVVLMLGHWALAGLPARLPTEPWLYGSILAVAALYILMQACIISVLPYEVASTSKSVVADYIRMLVGARAAKWVSAMILWTAFALRTTIVGGVVLLMYLKSDAITAMAIMVVAVGLGFALGGVLNRKNAAAQNSPSVGSSPGAAA